MRATPAQKRLYLPDDAKVNGDFTGHYFALTGSVNGEPLGRIGQGSRSGLTPLVLSYHCRGLCIAQNFTHLKF
jgi:hypothetical protein